jgi:hypothetical protein
LIQAIREQELMSEFSLQREYNHPLITVCQNYQAMDCKRRNEYPKFMSNCIDEEVRCRKDDLRLLWQRAVWDLQRN